MDPVIAAYTVLLAVALGLSGFLRGDARRRGRGLLMAATLSGFIVVAAASALVNAVSVPDMILTALAVFFSAASRHHGALSAVAGNQLHHVKHVTRYRIRTRREDKSA